MWFWRQNREISEEVLVIKYINNVICLDSVALVDVQTQMALGYILDAELTGLAYGLEMKGE